MSQAPTIGRRCYFWPTEYTARNVYNVIDPEQPLEAGVVFVHRNGEVNLSVADHKGRVQAVNNVPFGDYKHPNSADIDAAISDAGGYADFMPYQKGASHTAAPTLGVGDPPAV